jgi:hypothetical protein
MNPSNPPPAGTDPVVAAQMLVLQQMKNMFERNAKSDKARMLGNMPGPGGDASRNETITVRKTTTTPTTSTTTTSSTKLHKYIYNTICKT